MRTCGYCGYSVSDENAVFCPKCGKNLIAPSTDKNDVLSQINKSRRNTRIKISAGIGTIMGIGICAIQTNIADMFFHTIISFIFYFFISYFVIWVIQQIVKPKV